MATRPTPPTTQCEIPASPFGPRLTAICGFDHWRLPTPAAARPWGYSPTSSASRFPSGPRRHRSPCQRRRPTCGRSERGSESPKRRLNTPTARAGTKAASRWRYGRSLRRGTGVQDLGRQRQRYAQRPLYGALRDSLVSDRPQALNYWAMARRQICWAHLLRKYISFSERAGPAHRIRRQLLDYTGLVFDYWHDYKAGKLRPRDVYRMDGPRSKSRSKTVLARAVAADIASLSASCAGIHPGAQGGDVTLLDTDGVEPTNNHAEREIRAFVYRRKAFLRHPKRSVECLRRELDDRCPLRAANSRGTCSRSSRSAARRSATRRRRRPCSAPWPPDPS